MKRVVTTASSVAMAWRVAREPRRAVGLELGHRVPVGHQRHVQRDVERADGTSGSRHVGNLGLDLRPEQLERFGEEHHPHRMSAGHERRLR